MPFWTGEKFMKAKSQSVRKRLIGAKLLGFDTSRWRRPPAEQGKDGGLSVRSKTVSTKAGVKCKIQA
jgi:hypothetical protein